MDATAHAPGFGVYIIGDEILSGKRQDRHLQQAIALLKERGLQLAWAHYLGDDPQQITSALQRSLAGPDVVFSFGGIGATPDDHTRQSAAAAAGVPLQRHAGAVAELEAQFGEAAYPNRVLMADLPQHAELVPNPVNRVAGFALHRHYFLPGFPQMAWPMMAWVLDTHYAALFHQRPQVEQAIMVFDAGESQLLSLMQQVVSGHPQVRLFSLPRLDTRRSIELGVKGPAAEAALAMAQIREGVSAAGFAWQELG